MATHSSILAWRIPRTEEPGGLQSMGSQRARHEPATEHTHWENVCICRSLLLPLLLGAYPHFLGAPSLYFWPDPSCFLPLHTEGHVIHSQPELKPSASLVPIPHESKLVLFALCRGTGQGDASGKGTVVLIGISETMCSPLGTHSSASLAVTPQIPAASAPPEPGLHAPRRPVSRTAICPLGPGRTWGCGVQSPFFLFFFYFNKCYIKYTGQSTSFPCDGVHGSKIVPTLGHPFFRIYVKRRKFCLPGLFPSP